MNNITNIITCLPTVKDVRNGKYAINKKQLFFCKKNNDVMDYYNVIIENYIKGKYTIEDYCEIRTTLRTFRDNDLIDYKNEILDLLRLSKKDSINLLNKINEKNICIENDEVVGVAGIVKIIKYIISIVVAECHKFCNELIDEIEIAFDEDELNNFYVDINKNKEMYYEIIFSRTEKKLREIIKITELKEITNAILNNSTNYLNRIIKLKKAKCVEVKIHTKEEEIYSIRHEQYLDYERKIMRRG